MPSAWAEAPSAEQPAASGSPVQQPQSTEAARLFDSGVEHFASAQYEAAARAFLRADALDPDSDTLANALTAAKKGNDHLLVTEIARRALDVHSADLALVTNARSAMAAAARHLALVEVSCSPSPCDVLVDGEPVGGGRIYLNPGTHRFSATPSQEGEASLSQRVVEEGNLHAGTSYVFRLDLEKAAPTPPRLPVEQAFSNTSKPRHAGQAVFYSALGLTAVLAGVTTWSGVNAMQANSSLSSTPTSDDVDRVNGKVHRTDALLAVTLVSGAFAAGWGIWGTDFGARRVEVGALSGGGVKASVGGTFR